MDIVKFFSVWGVADKTFVIGREIKSFLAVQVSRVQIFLNRIVCVGYLSGNRIISEDSFTNGNKE